MPFQEKIFPLQQVLELACAAQRVNNGYLKNLESLLTTEEDGTFKTAGYKHANKILMLATLGEDNTQYSGDFTKPVLLCTNLEDQELANEIQKYYKRLLFAAIDGENEFLVKINSILSTSEVKTNEFGWVACLPSVYKRDFSKNQLEKKIKTIDHEYLDDIGKTVVDKDCEILSAKRSKNFDAWNIDAIIDNKMVSWMSKNELALGACVIVKAKVKDHNKHWKFENPVTRLNYVKAAQ